MISDEKLLSYVISVAAFLFLSLNGIIAWFIKRTITDIEKNLKEVKENFNTEVRKVDKQFTEQHEKMLIVINEEKAYSAKRAKEIYHIIEEHKLQNKELEKVLDSLIITIKEMDRRSDERHVKLDKELMLLRSLSERVIEMGAQVKIIESRVENFGKIILK